MPSKAENANMKADKATCTVTPAEEEYKQMRDHIKQYSNNRCIIIALTKHDSTFTSLDKEYRRRWWHLSCPNVIPVTVQGFQYAIREAGKQAGRQKTIHVFISSYIPYFAYYTSSALPSTTFTTMPRGHQEQKGSFHRDVVLRAKAYSAKKVEPMVNSKGKPAIVYDTFVEVWNDVNYRDENQ